MCSPRSESSPSSEELFASRSAASAAVPNSYFSLYHKPLSPEKRACLSGSRCLRRTWSRFEIERYSICYWGSRRLWLSSDNLAASWRGWCWAPLPARLCRSWWSVASVYFRLSIWALIRIGARALATERVLQLGYMKVRGAWLLLELYLSVGGSMFLVDLGACGDGIWLTQRVWILPCSVNADGTGFSSGWRRPFFVPKWDVK